MEIITSAAAWRERCASLARIALVPTMGNLHEGHLHLVRTARQHGDCVVASIFVNRLQFSPDEDFDRYPRTFAEDCTALEKEGVDFLFAPDEQEIYPIPQQVFIDPPPLANQLEGAFRPGFFRGVCTVVLKLFNLIQPDYAIFGKKDRQQLTIVQGMVQQLNLPIIIIPAETVRATDGLALSSRNAYLSPTERQEAPQLFQTLRELAHAPGEYPQRIDRASQRLTGRGWKVDYIAVRQQTELESPPDQLKLKHPLVVLGAAWLGKTRLIDNVDFSSD